MSNNNGSTGVSPVGAEEQEVIRKMAYTNVIKTHVARAIGNNRIDNEGWNVTQVAENIIEQAKYIPEDLWDSMIEGELNNPSGARESIKLIHKHLIIVVDLKA